MPSCLMENPKIIYVIEKTKLTDLEPEYWRLRRFFRGQTPFLRINNRLELESIIFVVHLKDQGPRAMKHSFGASQMINYKESNFSKFRRRKLLFIQICIKEFM